MTSPREWTGKEARDAIDRCTVPELIKNFCHTAVNGNLIPTRQVLIDRDVLASARDTLGQWLPDSGPWAVVMDAHTRAAAGERVLSQLPGALPVLLQPLPGWDHVTPHDTMVAHLAGRVQSATALVAVGSGTINDLCKTVAHQQGKPYAVVATAPSMNGYTSALAAIVFDGLKSTSPCPPPTLVLADLDVLITAPAEMARSGYADMMAKSVSNADWRLGSLVVGGNYSDLPSRLVERALSACIAQAEAIAQNEAAGIETLMQCLILSGFAMTLSGSSAPASGGEHLISHYWDMSAYRHDRPPPALHGLQVALGVLLTARLYELLWQQDPAGFTPTSLDLDRLPELHGDLWPAMAESARAQQLTSPARRVAHVKEIWPQLLSEVKPIPRPAAALRRDLRRGGVPTTPAAHKLSMDTVEHAFRHAAEIRNRYSVLHFAREMGLLDRLTPQVLKVFDV